MDEVRISPFFFPSFWGVGCKGGDQQKYVCVSNIYNTIKLLKTYLLNYMNDDSLMDHALETKPNIL